MATVTTVYAVESFPQNGDMPDRDTPVVVRRHYTRTGVRPLCGASSLGLLFGDELTDALGTVDEERACESCVRRIGDAS